MDESTQSRRPKIEYVLPPIDQKAAEQETVAAKKSELGKLLKNFEAYALPSLRSYLSNLKIQAENSADKNLNPRVVGWQSIVLGAGEMAGNWRENFDGALLANPKQAMPTQGMVRKTERYLNALNGLETIAASPDIQTAIGIFSKFEGMCANTTAINKPGPDNVAF